jgi:dienelactone hydrolase
MQVAVWYPAAQVSTVSSTYRDYVWLLTSEKGVVDSTSTQTQWDERVEPYLARIESSGVPREAIEAWLDSPVDAARSASVADGVFPLILVAQGNHHSIHNQALLATYLASRGFVVASAPSQGRITHPPQSEEEVVPSAEEQADDLQFLLAMAPELPGADASTVAVLGYSFGGRSALLFQMETGAAQAMVSLDSGIANVMGKGLLEQSEVFSAQRLDVPLLHVYQSGDEVVQPDFDLIESLIHSDRTLVELGGLAHGHFGSLGLVATAVDGFSSVLPEDGDVAAAWQAMATSVLGFLEATLKRHDVESFKAPSSTAVLSVRRIEAKSP